MPVMVLAGRYGVSDKLAEALRDEAVDLTSGHFVAEEVPAFFCNKLEDFLTC
jgi:hypothetical protein